MSDKNKNKKNKLTDFMRYQRSELSGKERNAFERELQKDPFTEEAADGFASISEQDALKDITILRKRLRIRTARGKKVIIYQIAASVAILMMISTLFIYIEKNKATKQLANNSVQTPESNVTLSQPSTEPANKDFNPEKIITDTKQKTGRSVSGKAKVISSSKSESSAKLLESWIQKNDSSPVQVSESAQLPVRDERRTAAVPDSINKTLVANFKRLDKKEFMVKQDTQAEIKIDTSVSALSEVVVTGYGIRRADSVDEDVSSDHIAPQPIDGKSKYDKYIQDNIHRPDSLTTGQRVVVVLSFLVRKDGSLDNIRIVRSPGRSYSDEAIRLLKSGPAWKAAKYRGEQVDEDVRLRIVFK
jgi:outer membrane biosynthesis protein TonB